MNVYSCVLLALLLAPAMVQGDDGVLKAGEAHERVTRGEAVLIDIRQPEEWRQTGLAADAVGISMQHPGGASGFREAVREAVGGDMDASIVLICRTGNRSSQLVSALRDWGYSNVHHVAEGMAGSGYGPGWLKSGLPVEDCQVC